MTTYDDSAYSEQRVAEAVKAAGWDSIEECVAELTAEGLSLTQIAAKLELSEQPFWAFWKVWCKANAPTLRLSGDESDA